jgi:hypothetical protein
VIGRITRRLLRPLRHAAAAWRARTAEHAFPPSPGALVRQLGTLDKALWQEQAEILSKLLPLYLEHHFNLLGSGWVKVSHEARFGGFGPHRYGPGAALPPDWRTALMQQAWPQHRGTVRRLLDQIKGDYTPLDWQVDFKSGWRWDAKALGVISPIGHKPGVDIKLPWELARLQHLPALAGGYVLGGQPGFGAAESYAREFQNQILDFIATNPAAWGVNWACAMDVAIRAANMALAWDLFRAAGAAFDAAFEAALASSLLAHGRFVRANLEWHGGARANHYLADIAGLAFIAAYLPRSNETQDWLDFTADRLDEEIRFQFLPDGAGFEGSTAYHRLSGELALYGVALLTGQGKDFSPESLARLAGAERFSQVITKPDGDIVQIGDNDSGRFFKLTPSFDLLGLEERHLDQRGFQTAAASLFGQGGSTLEGAIVSQLARGRDLNAPLPIPKAVSLPLAEKPARRAVRVTIPAKASLTERAAFPGFGLYIWRGTNDFVSVRCGRAAHDAHGAHAHNDQLSVEIMLDGVAWTRDPGSYVYTPDPMARDAYRSAAAHFAPRGAREPGDLSGGAFRLRDKAHARLHRFDADEFLGAHDGFGETVFRRVTFQNDQLVIEDLYGGSEIAASTMVEEHAPATPAELAHQWGLTLPFSPGYGRLDFPSNLSK